MLQKLIIEAAPNRKGGVVLIYFTIRKGKKEIGGRGGKREVP